MNDQNNANSKRDLSVSMVKANTYSIFTSVIPAIILCSIYLKIWGHKPLIDGFSLIFGNIIIFIAVFFGGIVIHEMIHGLTWKLFGRTAFNTIKFGFQLKTLTPYAHCKVPLEVNAYRLGTLMPGLVLGIIPAIIGIVTGVGWIMVFGSLFTLAAGGDFLILWLIRNVKAGNLVEDHPTNAGCYVIDGEVKKSK